jgi:2-polyprenyl-6-methoxyphenol hydroxylase-like FAD-dependent oxidoreductase
VAKAKGSVNMRAVIIGAGIAGLAVAKGLRLLGWETEIYE